MRSGRGSVLTCGNYYDMDEYYLLTFESTHAAIATEKLLKPADVRIMPVPRFISASCGISIRIRPDMREYAEQIFKEGSKLTAEDYAYYHVVRSKEAGSKTVGDKTSSDTICERLAPI